LINKEILLLLAKKGKISLKFPIIERKVKKIPQMLTF
jgi:hypothetical protein